MGDSLIKMRWRAERCTTHHICDCKAYALALAENRSGVYEHRTRGAESHGIAADQEIDRLTKRLALAERVCEAAARLDRIISMAPDLTIPGKFKCEREAITTRYELFHALKAWKSAAGGERNEGGEGG